MTLPHSRMKPLPFERTRVAGIEALLLPQRGSGLAAVSVTIRRGSADEGADEYGLNALTTAMLLRGTRRRSSEQLAYDLESIGAFAGERAGTDRGGLSVRAMADQMPAALEILFEALREPAFDARELEVQRAEVLAHLRMSEDDKFEFTYRRYLKAIFPNHGYGHPVEGEQADVERIDAAACRRWHAETIHPETMLLTAVGDFEIGEMQRQLERLAGLFTATAAPRPRTERPPAPEHQPELELTRPELQQGFVIVGYRTPPVTHEDYPALRLASAALGEGFGGRLFSNLRDRRGLAYALGSSLHPYRLSGHEVLYIGTKPETIDEARAGLLEEAGWVRENLLAAGDLDRAREYIIGKYLMGLQSLAQRAGNLAWWEDAAGDARQAESWPERLRLVDARQVREAAARWWVEPTVAVLRPQG